MKAINYAHHYLKWHNTDMANLHQQAMPYERRLRAIVQPDKMRAALDVGCGFGLGVYALKRMGIPNIMGIDPDASLIDIGRSLNLPVERVDNTIDWLKRKENSYDLIVSTDVIEHIPVDEQISFVRSICGALKQDGMFVCTVPNANAEFSMRWRYIDLTHESSFTENSLEFLLHLGGFQRSQIVEDEVAPRYWMLPRWSNRLWYLRKLARLFRRFNAYAELGDVGLRLPLSLNLLAIARKSA